VARIWEKSRQFLSHAEQLICKYICNMFYIFYMHFLIQYKLQFLSHWRKKSEVLLLCIVTAKMKGGGGGSFSEYSSPWACSYSESFTAESQTNINKQQVHFLSKKILHYITIEDDILQQHLWHVCTKKMLCTYCFYNVCPHVKT
jgi:hypothetical protein